MRLFRWELQKILNGMLLSPVQIVSSIMLMFVTFIVGNELNMIQDIIV